MAGRPRAPTVIVDPASVITAEALRQEVWIISDLYPAVDRQDMCMEWLARRGLLANSRECLSQCGQPHHMTLVAKKDREDGREWRCRPHGTRKSIRLGSWFEDSKLSLKQIVCMVYYWSCDMPQNMISKELGSWFEDSKLSLKQIVYMVYYWSRDMPQNMISRELQISKQTLAEWMHFIREICQEELRLHPQTVGGVDPVTHKPLVVEIDESKYFHRKYHGGQWCEGHWFFGGVERHTARCFLAEVPDHTESILHPLIQEHILPGTLIVSDGLRSYGEIDKIGGGIYHYQDTGHDDHCGDSKDVNMDTRNIENQWMRAKRKMKRQFGGSDPESEGLFNTYLCKFMWLQRFCDNKDHYFGCLLGCIREQYPMY